MCEAWNPLLTSHLRVRSALENCVLPLDSSAREPRSGSRRTIEEYLHWSRHMPPPTDIKEAYLCCIWRLEKEGRRTQSRRPGDGTLGPGVPRTHASVRTETL